MSARLPRRAAALAADARGVTIVEFAIAAPVLLLLLIGIYDMAHAAYLTSVLNGAVQQASRLDTLETADIAKADAYVATVVRTVVPDAIVEPRRLSYYDFADVKRPEPWNDKNSNGTCDKGETYTDENRNKAWDADLGTDGNGGANDVVLYTVEVRYRPVFPNPFMTDAGGTRVVSASAVHKNQPFALQTKYNYGSEAGTCR